MIVKKIEYSSRFVKDLRNLPDDIIRLAIKKEQLFKNDPLHPSLRFHQLSGRCKGSFSISLNKNYRIIFDRLSDGTIHFISIGKHDIYRCL